MFSLSESPASLSCWAPGFSDSYFLVKKVETCTYLYRFVLVGCCRAAWGPSSPAALDLIWTKSFHAQHLFHHWQCSPIRTYVAHTQTYTHLQKLPGPPASMTNVAIKLCHTSKLLFALTPHKWGLFKAMRCNHRRLANPPKIQKLIFKPVVEACCTFFVETV